MSKATDRGIDKVECPKCGTRIPISEALRQQLTAQIREELEQKVVEQEKGLLVKEKQLKDKQRALETQERDIERRVKKETDRALEKERAGFAEKEKELKRKAAEVAEAEKSVEGRVRERLAQERPKLEEAAKKRATDAVSTELKDAQAQLKEKDRQLERAREQELALRKRERELEDGEKDLELEVLKRVGSEKTKMEEEIARRIHEEHRFKEMEKEKQIGDLRKQIEELKRKAEQGSQQLQGEVQELDLEGVLKEQFPFDEIEPVAKGVRGADVVHRVLTRQGAYCGAILWESKRTKNWNEDWIGKLKDDQREAKADVAVLVSDALPKGIQGFALRSGVWVAGYSSLLGLAMALREALTQVALTKLAAESKDEKIEILFRYLTGPEFRQRVEGMIETFVEMKQGLDKEKRATIARWAKQGKQIERAIAITSGMHGDLRGLLGSAIQPIPALEAGEEEKSEIAAEEVVVETEDRSGQKDIPV